MKRINLVVCFFLSFFISLLATACLIPKILLISIRKHLIDQPNARKVHTCVSSRLGGSGIFPAIFFRNRSYSFRVFSV